VRHRAIVLAAVGVMTAGAAVSGCRSEPTYRQIDARVSDLLYQTAAASPFVSTAAYPHRTFENDRRIVLRSVSGETGAIRVNADLRPGAHLEFAFAAEPTFPGSADLSVAIEGREDPLWSAGVGTRGSPVGRWHDVRVDLGDLRGRVTIRFDGAAGGVYFSDALITSATRDPIPDSLILVSLDTLRADRLGVYGYDRPVSPGIDALFRSEGLVVSRVIANAADTLYAHTAMFTGERPDVGLVPGADGQRVQAPWLLSITDVLRARGYRTAAFTENALVGANFGFARGFDRYVEVIDIDDADRGGGHITRTFGAAADWIDANRDAPSFVFIHTYEVHTPYDPPEEYRAVFASTPRRSPVRRDSDLYDAEIAYTDVETVRLIERIRSAGVLDRSLLVVTSDHGEEFGEQGARFHGSQLHEPVLHVPLLLRAPRLLPAGVTRSGPMAQIDFMPTLLDLLAVPRPMDLGGRSLADHIVTGAPVSTVDVFSEAHATMHVAVDGGEHDWISPAFAVTRDDRRLIRKRTKNGARYELYDLVNDPHERDDIYARHAAEVDDMRRSLDEYLAENAHRRATLAHKSPGIGAQRSIAAPLDDERRRKLEALGYLEGPGAP
jgi:arylsulfatase A-like enzyme